jgi:hypothetical protein
VPPFRLLAYDSFVLETSRRKLQHHRQAVVGFALGAVIALSITAYRLAPAADTPLIEFSAIPPSGDGSPDRLETIGGRVHGARSGDRVVLFALSGAWWVQPLGNDPFTAIQPDSTWKNSTHPGAVYGALLVDSHYRPPMTISVLPQKGGPVRAVATVQGMNAAAPPKTLQFSGYQWELRSNGSNRAGSMNFFSPGNAWVDPGGKLHLRVSREADRWVSSEVKLSRSLGYGSYRFVVEDVSHLEPAAVFSLFTWDDLGPSREVDIEISRWGEPEDKNAQFVVQPYFVPANTIRFSAPAGALTYWLDWQPGRVTFQTIRGSESTNPSHVIAQHVFTSGVPSPGNERIHMNVYVYGNQRHPLQNEFEAVVDQFEFLP